ncbi:MAG: helix-turn-helix domain-containing protein [Nocardioides sp.]
MPATTYERELIAERLRSALVDAGVTTGAFAVLLGTSRPRLSTYLNGWTMPSAALYERALKTAAALKSARSGGWMTADNAIDEINKALGEGDAE